MGAKEIRFHIKPHDPRKMIPFKKYWEKHKNTSSERVHDAAAMRKDMFKIPHDKGHHGKYNHNE